jgi:hypothetical protein
MAAPSPLSDTLLHRDLSVRNPVVNPIPALVVCPALAPTSTKGRSLFLFIALLIEVAMSSCSTNAAHDSSTATVAPAVAPATTPGVNSQVPAAGALSFVVPTYVVNQAARSIIITAARSNGSGGAVSVDYKTANGTAAAGTNYTSSSGTLKWTDGDSSDKSFSVAIVNSNSFAGSKAFSIEMSDPSGSVTLGTPSIVTVTINGDGVSSPIVSKSISEWVPCDGMSDYTAAVATAFEAAKNNAFTLVVDCPVRLHTGTKTSESIAIGDGTIVMFTETGEFRVDNVLPPAFEIAHPAEVTLMDWNVTYVGS